MGDRENQRAAREIGEGRLVAQYLNETQGTDYEARAGDREPADVVLVSPTGQHPTREAQVVTIPRTSGIGMTIKTSRGRRQG